MSKITLPENLLVDVTSLLSKMECDEPLTKEFILTFLKNVKLFDNKEQDYGPKNIAKFGFFGCLVRMSDKFARMENLTNPTQKRRRAVNESLLDTLDDIAVYAIIARMCHEGRWPK